MAAGGAIYFWNEGTVTSSYFTDNYDNFNGGAVYFNGAGEVTNCNFTNNEATGLFTYGGAVYFYNNGNVANCNFTNNSAVYGGAVFFYRESTVTSCNFVNNTAFNDGGAVRFMRTSTVTSCNFTGNQAYIGGALYASNILNVKNSNFINNKAESTSLTSVNDNKLVFTFTAKENYINAIYSANVNFINVTYWNGAVVNSDVFAPVRSDLEAGIDIIVEAYNSLDELVDNETVMTNANGKAVYDYLSLPSGDYTFKAYHPDDSYYTYIENTGSFIVPPKFNLIVLDNQTVYINQNITMKINASIVNETNVTINPNNARLFLILPNGTEIEALYNEGIWCADYAFEQGGDYLIIARLEPDHFNYEDTDYVFGQVYSGTVTVKISDYTIGLNVVPGIEGADTHIDVTVPEDVTGTVTLTIKVLIMLLRKFLTAAIKLTLL